MSQNRPIPADVRSAIAASLAAGGSVVEVTVSDLIATASALRFSAEFPYDFLATGRIPGDSYRVGGDGWCLMIIDSASGSPQ